MSLLNRRYVFTGLIAITVFAALAFFAQITRKPASVSGFRDLRWGDTQARIQTLWPDTDIVVHLSDEWRETRHIKWAGYPARFTFHHSGTKNKHDGAKNKVWKVVVNIGDYDTTFGICPELVVLLSRKHGAPLLLNINDEDPETGLDGIWLKDDTRIQLSCRVGEGIRVIYDQRDYAALELKDI